MNFFLEKILLHNVFNFLYTYCISMRTFYGSFLNKEKFNEDVKFQQ